MTSHAFTRLGRLIVLAGALGGWSGHALGQDRAPESGPPAAVPAEGTEGKPSACARPVYPRSSLRAEHQGIVTMSFLISVEGKVVDAKILTSSGHALLDTTALEAISLCRFKPAIVDGQAIEAWTKVQYRWTLI